MPRLISDLLPSRQSRAGAVARPLASPYRVAPPHAIKIAEARQRARLRLVVVLVMAAVSLAAIYAPDDEQTQSLGAAAFAGAN